MRKMLNTLFVLTEDSYLSLDGENIVVNQKEQILNRYPLHTLEQILYFGYRGASPALMGACAERGVRLSFLSPQGKFLAAAAGRTQGNVLLRLQQVHASDDPFARVQYARNFVYGKVYNGRWVLERALRDHALRLDVEALRAVSTHLHGLLADILACENDAALRGLEGTAAAQYFRVFDQLILQNKSAFYFHERSRRPPLDKLNALLSFTYTLLANDCAAALHAVGLDPYIGFLHRERPGRSSLALDLMEELRAVLADRFVLSIINERILKPKDFVQQESGAVRMTDTARKTFLAAWQQRKQEQIRHPFLQEKIPWGLVPYVQALLLGRCLRGDLETYPPFLWK